MSTIQNQFKRLLNSTERPKEVLLEKKTEQNSEPK